MKTQIVQLNFSSKMCPEAAYEIQLKNLREAVTVAANNPQALDEIRKELLETLAYVDMLEYQAPRMDNRCFSKAA